MVERMDYVFQSNLYNHQNPASPENLSHLMLEIHLLKQTVNKAYEGLKQ